MLAQASVLLTGLNIANENLDASFWLKMWATASVGPPALLALTYFTLSFSWLVGWFFALVVLFCGAISLASTKLLLVVKRWLGKMKGVSTGSTTVDKAIDTSREHKKAIGRANDACCRIPHLGTLLNPVEQFLSSKREIECVLRTHGLRTRAFLS